MKNLILLIAFGLIMISCEKQEAYTPFYWNQTKCSDPWNTGENDSNEETKAAIADFLKSEAITVIEIDFDINSPLDKHCKSCGCGTGQRIVVQVMDKDKNDMKNLNFYQ